VTDAVRSGDAGKQRRALKLAMVQFHPDKTTALDMKLRVEAEAVFDVLKDALERLG